MNKSLKLKFQKGDFIAIILVIGFALALFCLFFFQKTEGQQGTIQIFQDGNLIEERSLNTKETISVDGPYHNTIVIDEGKVAITQSDCPGADCVHSGWISQVGRSIICLPNRVEIRIVGTDEVDFVVR